MKQLVLILPAILMALLSLNLTFDHASFTPKSKYDSSSFTLGPDSLTGYVYWGGAQGSSYYECTYESIGIGVENVTIKVTVLATGQVFEATTNSSGRFAMEAPPSGNIKIEPYFLDLNGPVNGITAADISLLQRHLYGLDTINCPLGRIAADFDRNGRIDTFDVVEISDYLARLADPPYEFNPWILVPNALNFPSIIHPDPMHVSNYWNLDYPDYIANPASTDPYYPFVSKLNVQCSEITYNTGMTWIDSIDIWDYREPNGDCGLVNYGFWLVKSGDLNVTADVNFAAPGGGN